MKFTPGPGMGGHCIPLDPHYLSWKLKTLTYNACFVQLAGEINTEMPYYWVDKALRLGSGRGAGRPERPWQALKGQRGVGAGR